MLAEVIALKHPPLQNDVHKRFLLHRSEGSIIAIDYNVKDKFFYIHTEKSAALKKFQSLRKACEHVMKTKKISVKNKLTCHGVPLGFFEHFGTQNIFTIFV